MIIIIIITSITTIMNACISTTCGKWGCYVPYHHVPFQKKKRSLEHLYLRIAWPSSQHPPSAGSSDKFAASEGTNISHQLKRKLIFPTTLGWDILVWEGIWGNHPFYNPFFAAKNLQDFGIVAGEQNDGMQNHLLLPTVIIWNTPPGK